MGGTLGAKASSNRARQSISGCPLRRIRADGAMSKAFALLMIGIMAIQIIKPLGLPGLKRRADFWKLALVAMAATGIAATAGHWG